jgi:hypothetical protein
MIAAGANAKALSTYLGHANIAITMDRYGHLVVLCWLSLGLGWLGEWNVIEVDGLLAGAAAAGPALEERLHEQHGLRECQAGRG